MVDQNIESLLVCEDDINFVPNFEQRSKEVMQIMSKHNWQRTGMLYLHTLRNFPNPDPFVDTIEPGIRKCIDIFGSLACYRITLDAAKKLCAHAFPIEMQVDAYVSIFASDPKNELPIYAAFPNLIQIKIWDLLTGDNQNLCIKCVLPSSLKFYMFFVLLLIFLIASLLYLLLRKKQC